MATYLVTGGAGFIGSHLCDALLENNKVYILDNLSSGFVNNIPKGAQFIEGDIRDFMLVRDLFSKVDGCFHLAALASVPACNLDLIDSHQVNLTGTLNIIEAARINATPVVFASSAAVYGDSIDYPTNEQSHPLPISMYAVTKLSGEYYGRIANALYDLPFTALRLYNVYGPRQNIHSSYSGVITAYINALVNDVPFVVYGDGTQSRDFIAVDDVVKFFIKAMETSSNTMRVYNVCTGKPTDINTLGYLLSQMINTKIRIEHQPAQVGSIVHSLGNPNLAKKELGINVNFSIEQGLKILMSSFFGNKK